MGKERLFVDLPGSEEIAVHELTKFPWEETRLKTHALEIVPCE
jgi:hypothetical protein